MHQCKEVSCTVYRKSHCKNGFSNDKSFLTRIQSTWLGYVHEKRSHAIPNVKFAIMEHRLSWGSSNDKVRHSLPTQVGDREYLHSRVTPDRRELMKGMFHQNWSRFANFRVGHLQETASRCRQPATMTFLFMPPHVCSPGLQSSTACRSAMISV